ncbi:phosphatase PAP2/dual specificity phosphatase family protein [Zoogloea sp.]|uniref:phosphatase PAP2/dual specificity phosphatase family protein n=1 Tax=Zoogloea sp. TaxID=49181 RepID=UPI001AC36A08|nr:phosphatase PAP2/dual specificity phosphatase family protein [Zoogloea sp.]MBN8283179.1 phosphatase PAP2/dual specificity phosphatase family protein [Zoogloea sp.]
MNTPAGPTTAIPWQRGVAWLLFLGPFFFLSYGFANSMAARWQVSDALVYEWEQHIPFLPWTILPYWSIDLFYGLSFLLCRTALQVDRHALRLLTAQLVSVACFLAFPLRFSFARPDADGLFGALFDALAGFDLPYNQAPSLHISLLIIIWVRFATATRGPLRWLVDAWAALIAVSVLTTYQHHFIDLPSGALVGLLCLWLWPDEGPTPFSAARWTQSPERRRLAGTYLCGALTAAGLGVLLGGGGLVFVWLGIALALVALNYALLGPAGFQKHAGRHALGAALLLAPYTLGAWLNSRLWTRNSPAPGLIADGVWLGRLPDSGAMRADGFRALLDLTAELPAPKGNWAYMQLPWLDLVPPDSARLEKAAAAIERLRQHGPVLVCCALGYSRSASAVAAWLLATGRASSVDAALAILQQTRPRVVLGPQHRQALARVSPPAELTGGA